MDSTTERLGSLYLFNESGEQVTIASLWESQTAVLVFVRHFG
jgi:hypothetical protein